LDKADAHLNPPAAAAAATAGAVGGPVLVPMTATAAAAAARAPVPDRPRNSHGGDDDDDDTAAAAAADDTGGGGGAGFDFSVPLAPPAARRVGLESPTAAALRLLRRQEVVPVTVVRQHRATGVVALGMANGTVRFAAVRAPLLGVQAQDSATQEAIVRVQQQSREQQQRRL
jgi:hypothetical protein